MAPISPSLQEEDNVVQMTNLRIASSGGGPDVPWIKELPQGTQFLYKLIKKPHEYYCAVERAAVVYHFDACTLLFDNLNGDRYLLVEDADFCRLHRRLQVIFDPYKQEAANVPGPAEQQSLPVGLLPDTEDDAGRHQVDESPKS